MIEGDATLSISLNSVPPALCEPLLPCLQVLSGSAAGLIRRLDEEEVVMGRQQSCQVLLQDAGVSRRHARLFMRGKEVWLEDLDSTNGTHVRNTKIQSAALNDGDILRVGPVLAKFGHLSLAELELSQRLLLNATRDFLTRALNRASFTERMEQEIAICNRSSNTFSLVMADADYFKSINDDYGHPAGDAVLRQLADIIRSTCRLEDVVGRYGGEEFCVILRNIGLEGACVLAERVRRSVEHAALFLEESKSVSLTLSLGLATWRPGESCESLIARADAALYAAKKGGRNQVQEG